VTLDTGGVKRQLKFILSSALDLAGNLNRIRYLNATLRNVNFLRYLVYIGSLDQTWRWLVLGRDSLRFGEGPKELFGWEIQLRLALGLWESPRNSGFASGRGHHIIEDHALSPWVHL